jgi:hypothetical protein
MLIFKYLSPEGITHVFRRRGEVSLRFALPRDYNDPYELFLQTDKPLRSKKHRAFYKYFLGKIKQFPVTCFSKRPDSVAMWAHYGRDAAGVCLAFDEDDLADKFPSAFVGDVKYLEGPAQIPAWKVVYAYTTEKNRHSEWLLNDAYGLAYFAKRSEWQYESERRLIVDPKALKHSNGILLAKLPRRVLRYIIVGPQAQDSIRQLCRRRASEYRVPLLELRIGKTRYKPFFSTASGDVMTWNVKGFRKSSEVCISCGEPARVNAGALCRWCAIEPSEVAEAATRSLMTIALDLGVTSLVEVGFTGAKQKGWRVRRARRS